MTKEEFLIARFNEVLQDLQEHSPDGYRQVKPLIEGLIRTVEFHQKWPVLIETEPEFEVDTANIGSIVYRVNQRIAWTTQEEYRKTFGSEPPTAPIIRDLLTDYQSHPEFNRKWLR